MGLITKLPRTSRGHDSIWVIADRLTKLPHFLLVREDYKMEKLAQIYINKIVTHHGVPISPIGIVSLHFTIFAIIAKSFRIPLGLEHHISSSN